MGNIELADSNDVLAQLRGGLHQNSRQNLHGGLSEAGDKVGTFGGVTLRSAETFAVEDSKALLNGLWFHHESGEETVGHVAPPLGETRLTGSSISSLGANLGDQDPGLLSDRLGG